MPEVIPGIQRWSCPSGSWSSLGQRRRGRWYMFGSIRETTAFVDLARWPPEAVPNRTEHAVSLDLLPDGRVVVCSMLTNPPGAYMIRVHPADWPLNPTAGTLEEYPLPGGLTLADVCVVSGRVVTFDSLIDGADPPSQHRAYLLDRGKFVVAPGLPPVKAFQKGTFAHQIHANGTVTLATGEEIFIWDGDGYEWTGQKFELRWELGARERAADGWTSVPWGTDGFFYLSDWKLMYARRGQRPVRVLPDAELVYFLSRGPDDSVIASQSKNRKRHVARVWFPTTGEYVPLFRGHFGMGPSARGGSLCWNADTKHVHIAPLWTVPGSALTGLKRVKPRGSGYIVPKV